MYDNWINEIVTLQEKYPICQNEYWSEGLVGVNPYCFMQILSKQLSENTIIIPDSGGTLIWTMQGLKFKKGQTVITQWNHSAMGCSIGMGIGAYYAHPDKQIVVIMGDGAFCMNTQELETIAYNHLSIHIFIINNEEYGIINQTFDTWLDCNAASCPENGLGFPDIRKVVEAYGIKTNTLNLNEKSYIERAIETNLKWHEPRVTIIEVKSGQKMMPKLTSGQPLENMWPYLKIEEIDEIMRE